MMYLSMKENYCNIKNDQIRKGNNKILHFLDVKVDGE